MDSGLFGVRFLFFVTADTWKQTRIVCFSNVKYLCPCIVFGRENVIRYDKIKKILRRKQRIWTNM